MWLFHKKPKKTIESDEFVILSARLNKLSCVVDTLEIESTSILKQLRTFRTLINSKFKIPEEKEDKPKDIYNGMFLGGDNDIF